MHEAAMAFAQRAAASLSPRKRVVELGGCDINGSVRWLFLGRSDMLIYTSIDLVDGPGVDVVADAADYWPDDLPDAVVCTEVLEHTPKGSAIVANAARMLVPGGWLLVTCATDPRAPHSAVDGGELRAGEFYANVPPGDLYGWAAGHGLRIEKYEIDVDRGDLRMLARKA